MDELFNSQHETYKNWEGNAPVSGLALVGVKSDKEGNINLQATVGMEAAVYLREDTAYIKVFNGE